MSEIRPEHHFHSTNGPLWNEKFRAFQYLVSEHSFDVVPTSLYNLTKSVPDPLPQHMQNGTLMHVVPMKRLYHVSWAMANPHCQTYHWYIPYMHNILQISAFNLIYINSIKKVEPTYRGRMSILMDN